MVNKNKPKMVTIQVIKPFNEGRTLSIGDRIDVHPRRARIMEQAGYAIRVDPEAPYTHPAKNPEHQFKEVKFDEPEKLPVVGTKVEMRNEKEGTGFKGEVESVKVEKPKPEKVHIPILANFSYLNTGHLKALKGIKVHVLNDLSGWDVDGLAGVKGISRKTAIRLIDDYNRFCNIDHNKDSDMEIKTK